jgi:protease secretion system membrane fusion protein
MNKVAQIRAAYSGGLQASVAEAVKTDARSYTRLGWLIVLLGVGGFVVWSMFAPLDRGVPLSGTVIVSGQRKAVQHETGGVIDQILVSEGDLVKKGQALVRMNPTHVRTQVEITRAQLYSVRAVEARLIAERDGEPMVAIPPGLENAMTEALLVNNLSLQRQLYASRQAALQSNLSAIDENIAGLRLQAQGLEQSRESKTQQIGFLKEQLTGMRDLANDGYVARNRLLELERTHAQLLGGLSEDRGNIGRLQRQIAELALRRLLQQQDYQKEVRQQLTDVQRDAAALGHRLGSQEYELANAVVAAPVDGIVVGMNTYTQGGVIAAGFRMMDIVPANEPLVIEGQLPVNLVDKVHAGLKVELVFTAFNQNRTPHVPGQVTQVSADRLVDEKSGVPYYKLKAQVAPEGVAMVADLHIRPGMPVELFVKTGERTMMSYLLKPLFDRAGTALSEE